MSTKLSKYELKHIHWFDIEYDRESLIRFLDTITDLEKKGDEVSKSILKNLKEILKEADSNKLNGLLEGDEIISRFSLIEKWARRGAVDIATENKFSKETFSVISNFPYEDYKLIIKRCYELVDLFRDVGIQPTTLKNTVAGA